MARDCHTVLRPSSRAEEKARVARRPRQRRGARGPVHLVRGAVLLARGAGLAARAHVRSRSRPSATATHQPGRRYLVLSIFSVRKYPSKGVSADFGKYSKFDDVLATREEVVRLLYSFSIIGVNQ